MLAIFIFFNHLKCEPFELTGHTQTEGGLDLTCRLYPTNPGFKQMYIYPFFPFFVIGTYIFNAQLKVTRLAS